MASPSTEEKIGSDDRRLKMTSEQLVDFVGMVAALKQGGTHPKGGEYKTGWHMIRHKLKERYNIDYSIDHLRAQWHLRLKVTRRKFYAVIDSLVDSGIPVNEETLDNEMMKKGAFCKACDSIVYHHFKRSWMELKMRKDYEDVQFSMSLASEQKIISPAEESTESNDGQMIMVEVKEEPSSSLEQFLSALPIAPEGGVASLDQDNQPATTAADNKPVFRDMTFPVATRPLDSSDSCPPPVRKRARPGRVEEDEPVTDPLSSIASSLRDLASASVRQANAIEGIYSLLEQFVKK